MNRTIRLILALFFIAVIAVSAVRVTQLIGKRASVQLDIADIQSADHATLFRMVKDNDGFVDLGTQQSVDLSGIGD